MANYQQFSEYRKKGLQAYREGRYSEAKNFLLQASEQLFLLAQKSGGKQKQQRLKQARELRELATSVAASPDVTPSHPTNSATKKPAVPQGLASVIGLEEVKEAIFTQMIYPFKYPELAASYDLKKGGGFLLYGPPGTGKTMIAKAIASELKIPFYPVKPSEIMSKLVGEAEKNIAQLFAQARENPAAVIFIDELEALVPSREQELAPVMGRLVPQILQELEGFSSDSSNHLFFIGATNEPWLLDPAILRPGRFDQLFFIPLPESNNREKLFACYLAKKPVAELDYALLAQESEGYSAADIKGVCEKVAGKSFFQAVQEGRQKKIVMEDIIATIKSTPPSVSSSYNERYQNFLKRNS